MDIFASKLRDRAIELGLSNAEVARRAGLTERRYAHYVSGDREPDLTTLVRIASVLQTSPNELLGCQEGTSQIDPRRPLLDRLFASANAMGDYELELIVIQAEAVARTKWDNRIGS